MTLLEKTILELQEHMDSLLASNPVLEVVDERVCPVCATPLSRSGLCPACNRRNQETPAAPIISFAHPEDFSAGRWSQPAISMEEASDYPETAAGVSLAEHVLRQVATELNLAEGRFAFYVLNSLDEDGLLRKPTVVTLNDFIKDNQYAPYFERITLVQAERVLQLIQRAEPTGVAAQDPRQAMIVQLQVLRENGEEVPALAEKLLGEGYELLNRKRFADLAHQFSTSQEVVRQAAAFIGRALTPYPASMFWGTRGTEHTSHTAGTGLIFSPDAIITTQDERPDSLFGIEFALPTRGALRIDPLIQQALETESAEVTAQLKKQVEEADLIIKSLQQRSHTFVRLLTRLVMLQREYLLHGDEHLVPLTRASLAAWLGLHESTISRAVANKTVQLPMGAPHNGRVIELSDLFDRSLHIRSAIRDIIASEKVNGGRRPFSDAAIADKLAQQGHVIARRTVAKYRDLEKIPPAHERARPKLTTAARSTQKRKPQLIKR
jgi:RNA polymerase sigma-54 factor